MKMNEEIDAMRTLGLDPTWCCCCRAVLALVITLPILGLIADVAGLVGGGLMAWIDLGIAGPRCSPIGCWRIPMSAMSSSAGKAPVFAVIIGIIGCRAG